MLSKKTGRRGRERKEEGGRFKKEETDVKQSRIVLEEEKKMASVKGTDRLERSKFIEDTRLEFR